MSLKLIAEKAGVSISTVSRVINQNNTKAASKEVQKKIWEIARQVGYIPNKSAQNLRNSEADKIKNQKRKSLYCLIARPTEESQGDPFYTRIISGIDYAAFKNGYVLEYTFQLRDINNGTVDHIMHNASNHSLIIIGRIKQELVELLKKYFKRMVCISLNCLNIRCDQVYVDGNIAAKDAVDYLYSLGHRRIGFIGESNDSRYLGFCKAIEELKLQSDSRNVERNAMISMEGGNTSMENIILAKGNPTAIFCSNDRAAIGALRACKQYNINVPEDISIIGMNDIETVQYVSPMLSTVHVPLEEMGKIAVSVILDRINGGHQSHIKVCLPHSIIKRESCSNVKESDK